MIFFSPTSFHRKCHMISILSLSILLPWFSPIIHHQSSSPPRHPPGPGLLRRRGHRGAGPDARDRSLSQEESAAGGASPAGGKRMDWQLGKGGRTPVDFFRLGKDRWGNIYIYMENDDSLVWMKQYGIWMNGYSNGILVEYFKPMW